jgi:hypothetical protein
MRRTHKLNRPSSNMGWESLRPHACSMEGVVESFSNLQWACMGPAPHS